MSRIVLFAIICLFACQSPNTQSSVAQKTASVDPGEDSCNSPDAPVNCCFAHMPASVDEIIEIAAKDEPGDRMIISGRLLHTDGKTPYPGVLLYAYHTDAKGIYSKNGQEKGSQKWHGHLHGWGRS